MQNFIHEILIFILDTFSRYQIGKQLAKGAKVTIQKDPYLIRQNLFRMPKPKKGLPSSHTGSILYRAEFETCHGSRKSKSSVNLMSDFLTGVVSEHKSSSDSTPVTYRLYLLLRNNIYVKCNLQCLAFNESFLLLEYI